MGPHAAALGMTFYTGRDVPAGLQERGVHRAARLVEPLEAVRLRRRRGAQRRPNGKAKVEPFLTGWLDEAANKFLARPTDVFQMKDGSMLVSDEFGGALFRITYKAPQKTAGR